MGVYIKGINKPTSCYICLYEMDGYCCLLGKDLDHDIYIGRSSDCPIVEIKPHGRLIDADALKDKDFRYEIHGIPTARVIFARTIELAPTIIEAETCNNSENTRNKAEGDAVNTSFPCDTCRFNPPSSCDGKPCSMCDTSNPLTNCYQKAEGEDG